MNLNATAATAREINQTKLLYSSAYSFPPHSDIGLRLGQQQHTLNIVKEGVENENKGFFLSLLIVTSVSDAHNIFFCSCLVLTNVALFLSFAMKNKNILSITKLNF